jgi:bacterioferritin
MNRIHSIELLNKAVGDELQSINQYLYFHFHFEDRGYEMLSKLFERISIVEMKHLEMLADRILFLGGDVELRPTKGVEKVNEPQKMVEMAKNMENESARNYNEWAKMISEETDVVTKRLFEELASQEEAHYNEFDIENNNCKDFGDMYLALQSMKRYKKDSAE